MAPGAILVLLALASSSYAYLQTALLPAYAHIGEDLDADPAGVAWTATGYFLAAAVCTPLLGRLGDMFGKRRMLVLALLGMAIGSLVSAVGQTLEVVIAGRVLQGMGGGVLPLCFGIARDELPAERVGPGIGLISATLGIGGSVGLVVGGLMIDVGSYRWVFWTGAAICALGATCVRLWVPESSLRPRGRVDVPGALLLVTGLTIPLLAISQANDWGWLAPHTLGLIGIGIAILAVWVWVERRTPRPLADIRLLSMPAVLLTNLSALLVGLGMFGAWLLIPQLLEASTSTDYGFGASATTTALVLAPGSALMVVFGRWAGIAGSRHGHRLTLILGALVATVAMGLMAVFHGSELAILVWYSTAMIGIASCYAALPNLIIAAVPQSQTGEATGFNAVVRIIGSSIGSQIAGSILAGSTLAATGLPGEDGYTLAFAVGAGALAGGLAIAIAIPRPAIRAEVPQHQPSVA